MSNHILQTITKDIFSNLIDAFSISEEIFKSRCNGTLFHPGEFGEYREKAVTKALRLFLPERFGVESGFIITNAGDVSTQCDIVIYDKNYMPNIKNNLELKFFPIEAVVGVGEIKSDIESQSELNEYLNKLSQIKSLRDNTIEPDVANTRRIYDSDIPFNQIFTFLLCNKFKFKPTIQSISYDKSILPRYRHNLILSLEDGIFSYKTPSGKTKNYCFPNRNGKEFMENWWLATDGKEPPCHIVAFASNLYLGITNTSVLNIDQALYLSDHISYKVE